MNNVLIIGSGNIGSRHLQGLKKVKYPLSIFVVDPSAKSLKVAEDRYNQVTSHTKHSINFGSSLNSLPEKIDLAIISTSSNIRREVTEKLLSKIKVNYIIFEKLLFQKHEDYKIIEKLLNSKHIKAWVNCSMRVTPFYSNLKRQIKTKKVNCVVNGSKYGFITNVIHFIDYIAYLTDCNEFSINTTLLDKKPYESKRKGFLEFYGTISVYFSNGSIGIFSCYKDGQAPVTIEIIGLDIRALANETNRKTWLAEKPSWEFHETNNSLPYQSVMTNILVEEILKKGECNLPIYQESAKIHQKMLEGIKEHLNNNSDTMYNYYPFT